MIRTKETFIKQVKRHVRLEDKRVLEIGCGTGNYTRQLAKECKTITAIDPDPNSIAIAQQEITSSNVTLKVGNAESLEQADAIFDAVIFTLSLHHIPHENMQRAITEAVRVTIPGGFLIFLEPTEVGSFFKAEITFAASDGDERQAKQAAYAAMNNFPALEPIAELPDHTEFQFDSVDDFISTMHPKKNLEQLEIFLLQSQFRLEAERRINIYRIPHA